MSTRSTPHRESVYYKSVGKTSVKSMLTWIVMFLLQAYLGQARILFEFKVVTFLGNNL